MLDRRTLLKWSATLPLFDSTAAVSAAKPAAPIIDTHLEVWTFDSKFPFHHPERPELQRVEVEAPIENEVAEMREFGLRYAVLINPRFYGWDNSYISYSLHRYPKLFVPHGLLNPAQPALDRPLGCWV